MSKHFHIVYPELVEDWQKIAELEVRGVIDELKDAEGIDTGCMIDDEYPEWFSVYARDIDGCSLCISDSSDIVEALEFMVSMQVKYPFVRRGRHSLTLRGHHNEKTL